VYACIVSLTAVSWKPSWLPPPCALVRPWQQASCVPQTSFVPTSRCSVCANMAQQRDDGQWQYAPLVTCRGKEACAVVGRDIESVCVRFFAWEYDLIKHASKPAGIFSLERIVYRCKVVRSHLSTKVDLGLLVHLPVTLHLAVSERAHNLFAGTQATQSTRNILLFLHTSRTMTGAGFSPSPSWTPWQQARPPDVMRWKLCEKFACFLLGGNEKYPT
jgi:hypothetical protein